MAKCRSIWIFGFHYTDLSTIDVDNLGRLSVTSTPLSRPLKIQVVVPRPMLQAFDYAVEAGSTLGAAWTGCRVRVPFGASTVVGIVISEPEETEDADRLKPIAARLDSTPVFTQELWGSLGWLGRYLHAPLGEVLATALPTLLRNGGMPPELTVTYWWRTEAGATARAGVRGAKQIQALDALSEGERMEGDPALAGLLPTLRTLQARGWVDCAVRAQQTPPLPAPVPGFALNEEQQAAADAIIAASGFQSFLLDGVTGSGKTEVYLEAIRACLLAGKQALVLVPEIGLTPQTVRRFEKHLGIPVHAFHSGMTDTARLQTWTAARSGLAQVVLGTRSAVFMPLARPGLIVMDEAHDGSYKQLDGIRYSAHDFAWVRARALAVPIVMGTATPTMEDLHAAGQGRFEYLRLSKRAGVAKAPRVRIMDVRKQPLEAGLSKDLIGRIRAALDAGGQVLVFRNRRGFAPVLMCRDCGWSAQCLRCDAAMTVHAHGKRLQCHHCGAQRPAPAACPECGNLALEPQGQGTERIETFLAEHFDDVPVIRIDRGSTQRKDALAQHFETLGDAPGILVGTQMLAKGHDLAKLALVAVLGIDEALFSTDFRASERVAHLLIQVAGRAGRAAIPGEVVLQTHYPDHPLLNTLVEGGYPAFADAELALREAAGFPPFAHMALLRAEAKQADAPRAFLQFAHSVFAPYAIEVSGPVPAPMQKRAGFQRIQLLLSAKDRKVLQAALSDVVPRLYAAPEARKVRWSLDIDPIDLY